MRFKLIAALTILPLAVRGLAGSQEAALSRGQEPRLHIEVNNRVLACPNKKPISVLDLMRRLDVIFLQQYPELADSTAARFRFYQSGWRVVLETLIDEELILADAEEREVTVNEADIHQDLESSFGPDVVRTLDQLGITYDEAREMAKREITVDRMKGGMIGARVYNSVNPAMVEAAYRKFIAEATSQDEWHYRVLSVRHPDRQKALQAANVAEELIRDSALIDLESIARQLTDKRQRGEIDARTQVSVSELEKRTLASLASSHRDVIEGLKKGAVSEPVGQVSRVDRCMAYRIFHLVDFVPKPPPSFREVEDQLRNQLMNDIYRDEYDKYVNRLRFLHGVTEDYLAQMVPKDFQPFTLH
jgi:hypothetical protein